MRKRKPQAPGQENLSYNSGHKKLPSNICLRHFVTLTLTYSGHIGGSDLEIFGFTYLKIFFEYFGENCMIQKRTQGFTISRLENTKFLSKPEKCCSNLSWCLAVALQISGSGLRTGIFFKSISKLKNCLPAYSKYSTFKSEPILYLCIYQ